MNTLGLAAVALFILVFGFFSRRLERTIITPPMVFVAFGLLASGRMLNIYQFDVEGQVVHLVAELTLVLVLFTDAARIDLKRLRQEHTIPVRLLGFGLPLTIILGTVIAAFLFRGVLTFWEGAVLAAILAPTDAALGQAVVNSPVVPVKIRQALNVESGLNDGIALPVVLLTLCLCAPGHEETVGYWLLYGIKQIGFGAVTGIAVAYLGGKLIETGTRIKWMSHTFQDLSALGVSLLSFGLAELVGGNGFIAAFCAGVTIGNCCRNLCDCLYEFAEAEGQLLTLFTFMIFGASMVWPALDHISWPVILFAVLSLTVIRMLPVAISLSGKGLHRDTVLFLGWFGPRGLASILFGLLVLEETQVEGRHTIFSIVVLTVLLSVVLHGLTAMPGALWYGKRSRAMKNGLDRPEHEKVTEMPTRVRWADTHPEN